jgi:hypothetical protein
MTHGLSVPSTPATDAGAPSTLADPAAPTYRAERRNHWDKVAQLSDNSRHWNGAYHRRLAEIYSFLIVPGQRVL